MNDGSLRKNVIGAMAMFGTAALLASVALAEVAWCDTVNTKARGHWTYKTTSEKVIPTTPGNALAVAALCSAGIDGYDKARVPHYKVSGGTNDGRWDKPPTSAAWTPYWTLSKACRDDKLFAATWQRRWESHAECSATATKAIWFSGVDDALPPQGTKGLLPYFKSHSSKWKHVGEYKRVAASKLKTSKGVALKPGDVLIRSNETVGHILIYVGNAIVRNRFPKSTSVFVESTFRKNWQNTNLRYDSQTYSVFRPQKLNQKGRYYNLCASYKKKWSPETKSVKVKDKYVYDNYKITYKNIAAGTKAPSKVAFKYDTATFTLSSPIGSPVGKHFVGWYTAASGGSKVVRVAKHTMKDITVYARYAPNTYTVTFKDGVDGKALKTQTVEYGKSASAPSAPAHVGRTFVKWDKSFSKITGNLTATAVYNVNKYTVTFKDGIDGRTLKTQTVEYGKGASAPSTSNHSGYRFSKWDRAYSNVTGNITVTAQYVKTQGGTVPSPGTTTSYTVTFKDGIDGKILSAQTVSKGATATAPKPAIHAGYTFSGWDRGYSNIGCNITVTSVYKRDATISWPTELMSIRNAIVIDKSGKTMNSGRMSYSHDGGKPVCPVSELRVGNVVVSHEQFLTYYFKNRKKGTATVVLRGVHSAGYKDAIILKFKIA